MEPIRNRPAYSREVKRQILQTLIDGEMLEQFIHSRYPGQKRFSIEGGESAIVAVVRSAHRAEAFAALIEVVDAVKHRVPIWKEEWYADGTSEFVEGCSIAEDGGADHDHEAQPTR